MTLVMNQTAPVAPPARRPRWRRWVIGAVVLIFLSGLEGWRYAGAHPALMRGSSGFGNMKMASDGITETRIYVEGVPDANYTVGVSIRNSGRFAVTVNGIDAGFGMADLFPAAHFALISPRGGSVPDAEFTATSITIPPGREAAVKLVVHIRHCGFTDAGGATIIDELPFSVSQLGVTSVQPVKVFRLPFAIKGTGLTPADCR